jgi:hypothetical protein
VQRSEFSLAVAFALETVIKPSLDLGLPRGIIHVEALADVGSQIQTLLHRKIVHCALEFNKAHCLFILGLRVFSSGIWCSRMADGGGRSGEMADAQDLKIRF